MTSLSNIAEANVTREREDLVRGNTHASLRSRHQPEAARSVLASTGPDPARQGSSRGLPAVPLHDHPQRSARRGVGRHEHRIKIDPGSKVDRRRHRPGGDGPGRRGGRDRAPGPSDQGGARRPGGTPSAPQSRKTRYRKPRFDNRTRPEGWLPPSLASRVATC